MRHDRTKVERSILDLNASTFSRFGTDYKATSSRIGEVYDVSPNLSVYAHYPIPRHL